MRIRRNAAKILGTAASPLSWFSPPPPPPAVEATKAVEVCQMNCSPWDSTSFVPPKEEEEGIMGNEIKREEPIYVTDSDAVIIKEVENKLDEDEREKTSDTKKKNKKRKKDDLLVEDEIETDGAVKSISISSTCKKTDGKLWRCKRQAQNPYTFCHYHLSQLQSYSWTKPRKVSAPKCHTTKMKKKTKKTTTKITAASVGSDSDLYYYYSKFGPSRGKKRGNDSIDRDGGGDDNNSSNGGVEEEEEDGAEERSGLIHCLVDPAGCDDVDDSDEVEEEEDTAEKELSGGEEREKEREKTKRGPVRRNWKKKKRGRKPVKARSLKSLL